MNSLHARALPEHLSLRCCFSVIVLFLTGALLPGARYAGAQSGTQFVDQRPPVAPRLLGPIDEHALVELKGNVRPDLTPERDRGAVEDSMPLQMALVLSRSREQQADLDNLIARQQQRGAAEYHKWLTPKQFGQRFGASPEDIAKLSQWLESHGFEVKSVLNNASIINFAGTSALVREAFHAQLHYYEIDGAKRVVTATNPRIPAVITSVVAGIRGLNRVPMHSNRTLGRQVSYDAQTGRFRPVQPSTEPAPQFADPNGNLDIVPGDFYTIYNVMPIFNGGDLGAGATIGVPEPTDMEYGTVNSTTGAATGGDVATFRTLFGVPGTLNMTVMHGFGAAYCADPGIVGGVVTEAALDAEWSNAVAPSARMIFMSCDNSGPAGDGFVESLTALIDGNLSDIITSSYGQFELYFGPSDYAAQDTLLSQAATQGQTFVDAAGDAGSPAADQDQGVAATHGLNVQSYAGTPLSVAVGGTDFQDYYDFLEGGPAQSTYWGATNSSTYQTVLGYIPETTWNGSCVSSIDAVSYGYPGTGLAYCESPDSGVDGDVIGGGGGYSAHYAQPAYQTGTPGLSTSATMRAVPDISLFSSNGIWDHSLIECDSSSASSACTSPSTFEELGGTSFAAPQFAGITALLVTKMGGRQGTLNPALYALYKAQYANSATQTACYSNGQTDNVGVTTGLPASSCIFNDVTTSNNDEPCAAGTPNCYVDSGQSFGALSTTGSSSLTVAYPAGIGYDNATGLGSINVTNLINNWGSVYQSNTVVSATPTVIAAGSSTSLIATVSGTAPAGFTGAAPVPAGSVTFKAGTTTVGTCTLSGGTCAANVGGFLLHAGNNSITANYGGSALYPSSSSIATTVTVTETAAAISSPASGAALTSASVTFTWNEIPSATGYYLEIGTTGAGSNNLYSSAEKPPATTSYTFTKMPINGETIYVRLYTNFNGTWYGNDYTYKAAGAALISPAQGSTFSNASVTFTWTHVSNATGYYLEIGTSGAASNNLYSSAQKTAATTSYTFTRMPVNGETIYVTLYTNYSGVWIANNYTFTAAGAGITSPAAGSTFAGASVTFTWTQAPTATGYFLEIGSTGVGSNNLYNSAEKTPATTTYTFTKMPVNGEEIYVRLSVNYSGTWISNDYTYTAAGAAVTSPVAGSVLTGASVKFTWTQVPTATGYYLQIGSTGVGSNNLYNSAEKTPTTTTYTFAQMPVNGETIYVRLSVNYSGTWISNDYTYTAAGAAITSPRAGSKFSGASVTFTWTQASGATGYYLEIGSTGVGSNNLYNSAEKSPTTTSYTFTAMPTNGEAIYVRLYTNYNGTWLADDYTYTAF